MGRDVNHPPPSSAEVKERVELYLYSTSGRSWPVQGRTLLYSIYVTGRWFRSSVEANHRDWKSDSIVIATVD
jgi:hypothetical protein